MVPLTVVADSISGLKKIGIVPNKVNTVIIRRPLLTVDFPIFRSMTINLEKEEKAEGLPQSVSEYNTRLNRQKKELYKNPPVLPPDHVTIEEEKCPLPKRDKKTGMLTFVCGKDKSIQKLLQDFRPNRTPEEVMRAGAFGGTYFRPITSAVTNIHYNSNDVLRDSVDPKWIEGLDKKLMLTSSKYNTAVNKYGVKCGGSLGMWESSGWISDSDW